MPLTAAKCPSCGANIQIPAEQEKAFCAYCGSQIITSAALAFYKVEVSGKVQIDTDPAVQAKLTRGRETGELRYFKEALDIDPDCYEARVKVAEAAMAAHNNSAYNNVFHAIRSHNTYRDRREPLRSLEQLLGADFFRLATEDKKLLISKAADMPKFAEKPRLFDPDWRTGIITGMQGYFSDLKSAKMLSSETVVLCRELGTAFQNACQQGPYGLGKYAIPEGYMRNFNNFLATL